MENVAIIAGLILGVASWWGLVRCMKINGRPAWWRHLAGLLLASFAIIGLSMLLASLLGVADENGEPLGALGAVGGLIVALPMLVPLAISWRTAAKTLKSQTSTQPKESLHKVQTENRQSVHEAMSSTAWKRKARKTKEKAKPVPLKPGRQTNTGQKQSGNLCFVYEDAEGLVTTREVSNWKSNSLYIEGFCLERGAMRTFRRDRILSFLEGEQLLEQNSSRNSSLSATERPLEVLFTGYDIETRQELEDEAELEGMKVRKSITQNLDFLCAGPNAGPRKLAEARAKGVVVMDETEFFKFLETGVVPS